MSSYLVQSGIVFFIVLGIYLNKIDDDNKLNIIIKNSSSLLYRTISKIIFVMLLVIFICGISLLLFYILLFYRGIDSINFYYLSFKYIFLYWGASIFVSFLLGMILGLWINKVHSYFLAIILSFFIGPLNSTIIPDNNIAAFLNLGQEDYELFYHPLYSFSLEKYQYIKRVLYITVLMLIIGITLNVKMKKLNLGFNTFYVLSLLVVAYCLVMLNKSEQIVRFNPAPDGEIYKELTYYKQSQQTVPQPKLRIKDYDINLETNGILHAKVKMNVINEKEEKEGVWLTLYHGFKIKSISVNNKNAPFQEHNDMIYIQTKNPGKYFTVEIEYEGISSPLFFANQQAVFLPCYFPWLPSISDKPFMTTYEDMFHRNIPASSHKANYHLTYRGNNKIYTNINHIGENTFKGTTEEGLTIVAGDVLERKINGTSVVIPSSWILALKSYDDFEKRIESILYDANLYYGYNYKIPDKVMILPKTTFYDSLFEDNAWLFNDHLIIQYPVYSNQNETGLLNDEYLAFSLIAALTQKKTEAYYNDIEMPIIFNAAYGSSYLSRKTKQESPYFQFVREKYRDDKNGKGEILKRIEKIINSKDKKKEKAFLREWHTQLLNKKFDWGNLRNLVDKYETGS
jgi:hydrogenase maturation factor